MVRSRREEQFEKTEQKQSDARVKNAVSHINLTGHIFKSTPGRETGVSEPEEMEYNKSSDYIRDPFLWRDVM